MSSDDVSPEAASAGWRKGILERLSRQGVGFELDVARRCAGLKLFVTQSHYYQDGESWREIDIVAGTWRSMGGKQLHALASIECKGDPGDWVLLTSESQLSAPFEPSEMFPASSLALGILEAFDPPSPEIHGPLAHRLVLLRDRKRGAGRDAEAEGGDKREKGLDSGYAATCQAVKGALGLLRTQDRLDPNVALVAIPSIVVRSPLWTTALRSDGTLDLVESDVGWMLTRFPAWRYPKLVCVVRDIALEHLVNTVNETLASLAAMPSDRLRAAESRARVLRGTV